MLGKAKDIADIEDASRDARWALVQRVVTSRVFRKSERQKAFLLFIADCALKNRLSVLNEHTIGQQVFGRSADYDPAEDNIVRVAARQLRVRLKEYFDTEGRSESSIIEIPKGGYVPVFQPRQEAPALSGDHTANAPARDSARPRNATLAWALLLIVVAASAIGWLWHQNRNLQREIRSLVALPNPISATLPASSGHLSVAVADFSFLFQQNSVGRTMDLEDYVSWKYPREGGFSGRPRTPLFNDLIPQKLTGFSEVVIAAKIFRSAAEHRVPVSLRHARELIVRDFHSGNFIIIGGPRANPWAQLFESRLNFRITIDPKTGRRSIVNRSPRKEELLSYLDGPNSRRNISYARIAVLPNLTGSGKVMLIGDTQGAATEAAGEFMLMPSALKELQKTLNSTDLSRLDSYELLVEISALDGTPRQTRFVSWRAGHLGSP